MFFDKIQTGRIFLGAIPHKADLLLSIYESCNRQAIKHAIFSVSGSVLSATIGSYDQHQQVYASSIENTSFEILSCKGNVCLIDNRPFISAYIVLSDHKGLSIGGRLFSETLVFQAQIELKELIGTAIKKVDDHTTGLFLWK